MFETLKFIVDAIVRPDNAMAHYNLGNALTDKGDLDGAIAEYRTALRLQPDNAVAHYNLGRVLWTKGDREAAFEEFHTAYRLAPNEPTIRQIYYNLMHLLER
jgi:Flp pilus assembly protein TadD